MVGLEHGRITLITTIADRIDQSEHGIEAYLKRMGIAQTKLRNLLWVLQTEPERSQSITFLRIEPFDGKSARTARKLVDLLDRLSPQLVHLHILPIRLHPLWDDAKDDVVLHDGFFTLLRIANIPFPKLTHLRYALGLFSGIALDTWMEHTHIEDLHITSAQGSYDAGMKLMVPEDFDLPYLRRITFDHLDNGDEDCSRNIILRLLRNSKPIVELRLRGNFKINRKDEDTMFTVETALRRLIVSHGSRPSSYPGPSVKQIHHQGFHRINLCAEESAIEMPGWGEPNELDFGVSRS